MQVIPAVDVLDGRAVRLLQGDYDAVTRYGDDPFSVIDRWGDEGADLVHVVDLGGARTGRPDGALYEGLRGVRVSFQLGGGIRTADAAASARDAGASGIVAGSVLLGEDAASFVSAVGAESIVAAVDVRGGRARGSGWLDEGRPFEEAVARILGFGVGTFLVTGIETDGAMTGPDLELLTLARTAIGSQRLIASGGVGTLDDLDTLVALGADAVIIGRALYERRFTLGEAIRRSGG